MATKPSHRVVHTLARVWTASSEYSELVTTHSPRTSNLGAAPRVVITSSLGLDPRSASPALIPLERRYVSTHWTRTVRPRTPASSPTKTYPTMPRGLFERGESSLAMATG